MANASHSYKFNFKRQLNKLKATVVETAKKRCLVNIATFVESFYKYYAVYTPVPTGYNFGVVGKYSTGNYFKSLEILYDDKPILQVGDSYKERHACLQEFLVAAIEDGRIPKTIVFRNLAKSKSGFAYYTRVETKGWKRTPAYEPLKKAYTSALAANRNLNVSSPRTGGRYMSFNDDKPVEFGKSPRMKSKGWGSK